MKNLRVVIDTNVFIVMIPSRSKHHWLFEAIRNGQLNLLLSSEIALEYEEQLGVRYKLDLVQQLLHNLTLKTNIERITPYYSWNLISSDADDNKFVDCAIAGNADYLLTHDADFNVLKTISFPKVNVVRIEEFEPIFRNHNTSQGDDR